LPAVVGLFLKLGKDKASSVVSMVPICPSRMVSAHGRRLSTGGSQEGRS
jgi:hypothetical protein